MRATALRSWARVPLLLILMILVSVAGCGADPAKEADPSMSAGSYRPVPDQELIERLEALPGVTGVQIEFGEGSMGVPSGYSGTIRAESQVDPVELLDRAVAILWQGRPGDVVTVGVVAQGGPRFSPRALDLLAARDFVERYGEHPGDGEPPSD